MPGHPIVIAEEQEGDSATHRRKGQYLNVVEVLRVEDDALGVTFSPSDTQRVVESKVFFWHGVKATRAEKIAFP